MVAVAKVISMWESELNTARFARGIGVLTGTSTADVARGAGSSNDPFAPEYRTIHRRRRFALIPCVSAVRATDTPGCLQSSANARLPETLYVRRPFTPCRTTKPSTTSTLFSDMVSTKNN
jgi:hypothetical protein